MRVAVDGIRLFVDFEGAKLRPDGPWLRELPTAVVLHTGPGADHTPYKEHVGPALSDVAQVLYVDLRGHGRSDLSTPETWRIDRWADDLRALLGELRLERPSLVGAGWGCYTALRFAQRFPDELDRLVLVNPVARMVTPLIEARYDELGGLAAAEAARAFHGDPNGVTVGPFMRECFPVLLGPAYAQPALLRPLWNLPLAVEWVREEGLSIDLRPELDRIEAETLIVAGTDDAQYPRESIEEVAQALPRARVRWYERARHSVFRDAPECLGAMRSFLAP